VLSHITVTLQRTPEQHAALDRLLEEQQDPASPNFQRRLTPEEFAAHFGATDDTVNRITNWLLTEGLSVESVARGHGWIVFSGTAAEVQNAFHTEIHRYHTGARLHFAPAAAPSTPAEFENLIGAIRGLDDFYLEPPKRMLPQYNASNGTHALAPRHWAHLQHFHLQYVPLGRAKHRHGRAVGDRFGRHSEVPQHFQLPPNDPQTMLVGDDPGTDTNGGLQEADVDIEWAGAASRIAAITYAYAKDVFDATQQVIDQNLVPILTFSFSACEPDVSATDAAAVRDLAEQANAQGITWMYRLQAWIEPTDSAHKIRDIYPASPPTVRASESDSIPCCGWSGIKAV
jgi:subtilase family serine protease